MGMSHRAPRIEEALEAPTRQIAENSGVDAGVVVSQMGSGKAIMVRRVVWKIC
jgi:chaperonin GroEL (HSP60 family)